MQPSWSHAAVITQVWGGELLTEAATSGIESKRRPIRLIRLPSNGELLRVSPRFHVLDSEQPGEGDAEEGESRMGVAKRGGKGGAVVNQPHAEVLQEGHRVFVENTC